MPARRFTAEQVDAAVAALSSDSERFVHAQEIVTHAAPGLQRVLNEALSAGGWFGEAHEAQITGVAATADGPERESALRVLIAEETRLSMLVGVAGGLELARELFDVDDDAEETT